MFLPSHEEIGKQDWFTKMLLKSNEKSETGKTSFVIGGIETRSSFLLSQTSQSIKKQRKSVERTPSVS